LLQYGAHVVFSSRRTELATALRIALVSAMNIASSRRNRGEDPLRSSKIGLRSSKVLPGRCVVGRVIPPAQQTGRPRRSTGVGITRSFGDWFDGGGDCWGDGGVEDAGHDEGGVEFFGGDASAMAFAAAISIVSVISCARRRVGLGRIRGMPARC